MALFLLAHLVFFVYVSFFPPFFPLCEKFKNAEGPVPFPLSEIAEEEGSACKKVRMMTSGDDRVCVSFSK